MNKLSDIARGLESNPVPVNVGDVLQLEGYSYNKFVIVEDDGQYIRVFNIDCPEDNAHLTALSKRTIRHISDKFGIGYYATDEEPHTPEQVAGYLEEAARQAADLQAAKDRNQAEADRLETLGRELWPRLIGDCPAVMVAELAIDQSDCMTDYYGHTTGERVILAPSKHKRDLFPEMRKAAALLPETRHLSNKLCRVLVVFAEDYYNGSHAHYKGQVSPWHDELTRNADGDCIEFNSPEEAQAFINAKGGIHQVQDGEAVYSFEWEIKEEDIEHREKYSMGAGYYLGRHRHSGWKVFKHHFYNGGPGRGDYIDLAKRHDHLLKPAAPTPPPAIDSTHGYEIGEYIHTKKGFQMWIVSLSDRVSRETFTALLDTAKGLGGWYSKPWGTTPGGFAFKVQANAETFAAGLAPTPPPTGGDGPAKPVKTDQAKAKAEKLRGMAERMREQADEKRAPMTQNATPKRTLQYKSRCLEGDNMERAATVLSLVADRLEAGDCPADLAKLTKADALKFTRHRLDHSGGYYEITDTGEFAETSPEAKAVQALLVAGLSPEQEAQAVEREKARDIENRILAFAGQKIPGFFVTHKATAERVIYEADLKPGDTVLEPSAGTGNLADLARAAGAEVVCVEIRPALAEILRLKGYPTACDDFLSWAACDQYDEQTGTPAAPHFDKVIMNPPFEKGQDMEHVIAAFKLCLKPGGRLVAITGEGAFFRSDTKAKAFRQWLDHVGGVSEPLPEGSFAAAGEVNRTGTAARIVIIDKAY